MHITWSGSYIASVRIPFDHPFAFATFEVSTSSCKLNPRANLSHSFHFKVCSVQVLIAWCKTAMTHTRLTGVSVTLLLVSHDATNEQTSPASLTVGPMDFNSFLCALCPSVKKFNPTGIISKPDTYYVILCHVT